MDSASLGFYGIRHGHNAMVSPAGDLRKGEMLMRLFVCLFALAFALPLSAVTIGQVDTFADGTTMGWFVPGMSPNPPINEPTGGPAGVGDGFLQLRSSGLEGPGGRLAVLN